MQYLIPQAIFIASLVTVLLIVFRRLPDVTFREEEQERAAPPTPQGLGMDRPMDRLKRTTTAVLRRAGAYAREAKDHTARAQYLQRFMKVLDFKSLTQRLGKSTVVITRNQIEHAESLVHTDDFDQAEQAFIHIIERDPGNQEAYENLGKLYISRKRFKEALEVYDYLTKEYPKSDLYWSRLGQAHFELANYAQAADAYRMSVELQPSRSSRYINLSLSLAHLGKLAEAETAAYDAVKRSPGNTQYLMVLADCLIAERKAEDASEVLEKILQLQPTSEEARQRLAQLKV